MNQNPIIPIIINYLKFNYELDYQADSCIGSDLIEKQDNTKISVGRLIRQLRKIFSVEDVFIYTAFNRFINQDDSIELICTEGDNILRIK